MSSVQPRTRRRLVLVPAALATAALAPIAAAVPAAGAAAEPIPLAGTVRLAGTGSPGGAPPAGARVELLPMPLLYETIRDQLAGDAGPAPVATAEPATNGDFGLLAPHAGLWVFRAAAPGRVPWECPLAPFAGPLYLPVLELPADARFAVRVESADGEPLPGARVIAYADPESLRPGPCRPAIRNATAGDDGVATLPYAPGEPLALAAVAAGHPPSAPAAREELPGVEGGVRIRLPAGDPRRIEVREAVPGEGEERPAAGVVARDSASGLALAASDAEGRLELTVPAGEAREVELLTADGRLVPLRIEPERPGPDGSIAPLTVRLPPAAAITGRVVAAGSGKPLPGAVVGLAWIVPGLRGIFASVPVAGNLVGVAWEPLAAVRAGNDGTFTLPAAGAASAEGAIERWATACPFELSAAEVVAGTETAAGGEIALDPIGFVAGTVVDDTGSPVEGAAVFADTVRPLAHFAHRTLSGAGGGFLLGGLEPGTEIRLRAVREGYVPGELTVRLEKTPQRPPVLRLVLRRGVAASGRVEDETGVPVAGAAAFLLPPGRDSDLGGFPDVLGRLVEERLPHAESDADGRFRFTGIDPARYDLLVGAAGRVPVLVPGVEVAARDDGEDAPLGTVVLEPEEIVDGRAVTPDGDPVAGARVVGVDVTRLLLGMVAPAALGGTVIPESDADGRFALGGVRAGTRIDLRVEREGYLEAAATGIEVPPAEPLTIVLEPLSAVSGRVVDSLGEPVAGAHVALAPAPFEAEPVTSDPEGRFTLTGVAAGEHRLAAWAPGLRRAEAGPFELPAGGALDGVEIVLAPGAVIEGRVLAADGTPAEGAWVGVAAGGGLEGSHHDDLRVDGPPSETVSDAEGRFRIDSLAPGPLTLSAWKSRLGRVAREVVLVAGENRVEIVFPAAPPRHRVAGRVVGAGGEPVAEAPVEMTAIDAVVVHGGSWSTETRADGSFAFGGAGDGRYRLEASHPGTGRPAVGVEVRVAGAPVEGVELALPEGGWVSGRVLGLELDELSRIEVRSRSAAGWGPSTTVAHDGSYRLGPLVPGIWRLAAVGRWETGAAGVVELAPGQTEAQLDLDFGSGSTLTGRLTEEGRPLAGAWLVLFCPEIRVRFADSDPAGRFRFGGLRPARCRLEVEVREALVHREEVTIEGDADLEIEIAPGAVAGRVTGRDGAPLPGARIELRAPAGPERGVGHRLGGTVSGADGGFHLRPAPAGRWHLTAHREGWTSVRVEVEVEAGAAAGPVELTLEPAPELELVVRLPSGLPPGDVRVALLDAAGEPLWQGEVATGEGGRLLVPAAGPDAREIVIGADGYGAVRSPVPAGGAPPALTVPPESRLTVAVPELTDAAAAGAPVVAWVSLLGPDGRPVPLFNRAGSVVGASPMRAGEAWIEGVPPGSYRVVAESDDGRRWSGTVSLEPGADGTAELR